MSIQIGLAQGKGPKISKQQVKQVNKEARKLAKKGEQAGNRIGRDAVFCLLEAHTTDVGTAAELKAKFESLMGFSFGDFVVAVFLSEITEISLDEIIEKHQAGLSFGEIAREADADMGEVHRGIAGFRLEVIQTMTHPPTVDCFAGDGTA
jgi:hypothetical protein